MTKFSGKGLATRARIVDTTAQLMFERGVENTTMEDVRERAEVSGSQLSHYFRGKADLTREVLAERKRHVAEQHSSAFDTIDAFRAWADHCVADITRVYQRGGCVYGSLAGELIEGDESVRDEVAAGYDEWIRLFRDGLSAMKARGTLRTDADPRHLAVSLIVAHQGGALLTFVTDDPEPLRANLVAAVDYVRSFTENGR
jgi:TetR/AcrR family transcriptional repressor of nem operon